MSGGIGRSVSFHVKETLPKENFWLEGGLNFKGARIVRSYDTLPAFAKGFSIGTMPFKINRLTENVNPIKLHEYLAAELSVVSTPLPEAQAYAKVVRFGANVDEFVEALDLAVNDTSKESLRIRLQSVKGETWVARVDQISQHVENLE